MTTGKKRTYRRPIANRPKGFRDYFGSEVTARNDMLREIARVYVSYGFDPLETSAVETLDALGKFLPDLDRPNEGVFAWKEDGDWLALRYDLTAPLARAVAQYRSHLPNPYRRFAMGPVWRNEKPGPGRFRQFYQCDADTVGSSSMAADAEMCAMTCEVLESVGIRRGEYIVKVSNRKILDGVLESAGVVDNADPDGLAVKRGIVLRAVDKLDRIGLDGVKALLGEGRTDSSGDYTVGAGLDDDQIALILDFVAVNLNGSSSALVSLKGLAGGTSAGQNGLDELEEMFELLDAQGFGADRVRVDPSIVRGLGYYTGPVIEAELTRELRDSNGRRQQFGSVAGGGRYDSLVRRFTGQDVPATGVSIGVDRLLAALEAGGAAAATGQGPVLVTVMDRERMADYQLMAAELRCAGIRAEVFLGNAKNFGRQLKYADIRNCPIAVIAGGDERERGVVQLKDLVLGSKIAETATHVEWKTRPSQIEVARKDLVAAVQRILNSPD